MKIFYKKDNLLKYILNEKDLGFVPTMGAIHKGHLNLIKKSKDQCKKTLVTIYINKQQFNKKIDFLKYPKVLNKDIAILKKAKIDYLYIPKSKEIYPKGANKNIKISSFSNKLCGRFRPGHFKAVVDVIERFIKIISPKKIYLGEKDMQQLKIVEHYIKKNYKHIKVVACKTAREKNGVAYSSRNKLLSVKQMKISSKIYRLILNNKQKLVKRKIPIKLIKNKIFKLGVKKIDYIEILDVNNLIKPYTKNKKYKIFIAYYLGFVRLIDNI